MDEKDGLRRPVSDAELVALKVLWKNGSGSVADVRAAVAAERREWAYTTTKTVLDRLEAKGYVARDRSTQPHIYTATVSDVALAGDRVRRIRTEIFGGAGSPMVRALLDGARLSPEEVEYLRALLEELSTDSAAEGER